MTNQRYIIMCASMDDGIISFGPISGIVFYDLDFAKEALGRIKEYTDMVDSIKKYGDWPKPEWYNCDEEGQINIRINTTSEVYIWADWIESYIVLAFWIGIDNDKCFVEIG